MGNLVSDSKNAFVEGNQILDLDLKANEVLEGRVCSKVLGIICKLDTKKAYDHVNWEKHPSFIELYRFGEKWRLNMCISSIRFSILIIARPADFFASSRGLRQGDLLSPLFFILVMEVLSKTLNRAVGEGWLTGITINVNDAGQQWENRINGEKG